MSRSGELRPPPTRTSTKSDEQRLLDRIRATLEDPAVLARVATGSRLERERLGDLGGLEVTDESVDFWLSFFSNLVARAHSKTQSDLQWALTSPEVQAHSGKLVTLMGKRVVAVGTDETSLLDALAERADCPARELTALAVPGRIVVETNMEPVGTTS